MTPNVQFVTTFLDTLDRQDWPAAMELTAPNAKIQVGSQHVDRDGWRAFGTAFYLAFPDGKHSVIRAIDAGEHVTVIATFAGTHKGELMGIPATGRSASIALLMVYRVANGRIVEHVGQFDSAGLMQQLSSPAQDLVRQATEWYRRIDARDPKVLELVTPDFSFSMGAQKLDRDGYTAMDAMFFSAFPDGHHVNGELVPVGIDRVLVKGQFIGTHSGAPLHGIPATGKKVAASYFSLIKFAADGKVHNVEAQMDAAGLMQQLTS